MHRRKRNVEARQIAMLAVGALACVILLCGLWVLGRTFFGFGELSRVESADPADVLDLPTSEWEPGSGALMAGGGGVLRLDEDACVYLEVGPERVYAVWPKGYAALVVDDSFELLDRDGDVVARGADEVAFGGGAGSWRRSKELRPRCLPSQEDEVFFVQSEVDVLRQVTDTAEEDFLRPIFEGRRESIHASVDREAGEILLAVSEDGLDLSQYSGRFIGELMVVIRRAKYSPADFEHVARRIGDAHFTDRHLLGGFNLPPGANAIEVAVHGLHSLDAQRAQRLRASVRDASGGADIRLIRFDQRRLVDGSSCLVEDLDACGITGVPGLTGQ